MVEHALGNAVFIMGSRRVVSAWHMLTTKG